MIRFVRTSTGGLRVDEVKQIDGRDSTSVQPMTCYEKVQRKEPYGSTLRERALKALLQ